MGVMTIYLFSPELGISLQMTMTTPFLMMRLKRRSYSLGHKSERLPLYVYQMLTLPILPHTRSDEGVLNPLYHELGKKETEPSDASRLA